MKRSHKGSGPPQRLKPCMPPLLEEETLNSVIPATYSGTACENLVKTYFLMKNVNIAEPNVDDGVDLLIQNPREGWVRGQIKKVVYQNKIDYNHKRDFGGEIYRSRFNFNFQGGGQAKHKKRKQRTPLEIDYFYHVLITPFRQLIWETPAELVPLRSDGSFIHGKCPCIDRDSWIRKKADINFNDAVIFSSYDPIILKSYPEFFLPTEKISPLELLFDDDS